MKAYFDRHWDLAAEHTAAAKAKGLDIILNIDPRGRSLLKTADPYRFQQVVNNLLSNAIKYTESGQIRCWLLLETSDPRTLHLNGTGVDSAAIGYIFEPFTQEDHSPVPASGIGMRLAIVKKIVDWQVGEFGIGPHWIRARAFAFAHRSTLVGRSFARTRLYGRKPARHAGSPR